MIYIYDKIQALCKEKGMTISELEEAENLPRGMLYKWNTHIPRADRLARVANRLGKNTEYFLGDYLKE